MRKVRQSNGDHTSRIERSFTGSDANEAYIKKPKTDDKDQCDNDEDIDPPYVSVLNISVLSDIPFSDDYRQDIDLHGDNQCFDDEQDFETEFMMTNKLPEKQAADLVMLPAVSILTIP